MTQVCRKKCQEAHIGSERAKSAVKRLALAAMTVNRESIRSLTRVD